MNKLDIKTNTFSLSYSQQSIWVHQKMHPESNAYNIPVLFKVDTNENEAIVKAIQCVLLKYDILRAVFNEENGIPFQYIKAVEKELYIETIEEKDPSYTNYISRFVQKPFDISKGPLYRFATVINLKGEICMLMVFHHLITDGTSLFQLAKEIRGLATDRKNLVALTGIDYQKFVSNESNYVNSEAVLTHKEYWIKKLSGELTSLSLPYDYVYNSDDRKSSSKEIIIDAQLRKKLEIVAKTQNSSIYNILFACFSILIHRLSGENDIIIGCPVINRSKETLDVQGLFLNTVMLRNEVGPEMKVADLIKGTKTTLMQALRHKIYPFGKIIADLKIPTNPDSFPISNVFFNGLTFFDEILVEEAFNAFNSGFGLDLNFDLNCYIGISSEKLMVRLDYRNTIFKEVTIDNFLSKYLKIIELVCNDPEQKIRDVHYSTASYKEGTIDDADWYDAKSTIVDVFNNQALRYNQNIAVKCQNISLTYKQLNIFANQIANTIIGAAQKRIGVCVTHGHNLAAAVLGVLKAGKSYIPLDVSYPVSRMRQMVEEAEISLVIVDGSTESIIKDISYSISVIDISQAKSLPSNILPPEVSIVPDSEAYIMFTSGSTGKSKGVVQKHKNVLHFISQYSSALSLDSNDCLTGFSPITYDSFNNDFFGAILNGATYCPLSIKDSGHIDMLSWLIQTKITIWHSVPGVFRIHAEEWLRSKSIVEKLRIVKMTGEAVRVHDFELFKKVTQPTALFVVSLGSTESTLSTINIFKHADRVERGVMPVGFPLDRTKILVWGKEQQQDVLEPGEIVVESGYVAPSYYNDIELSNKVFKVIEGSRCYLTGDWGRKLLDGRIEWISRKDTQIKLNGVRVESGEIENYLLSFNGGGIIKEVLLLTKYNSNGEPYLCAYYSSKEIIDENAIVLYLIKYLPQGLIPSVFVWVKNFPYSLHGKIDKNALPEPVLQKSEVSQYASNQSEEKLVAIWSEVLGIDKEKISIEDNFFKLGGNSLNAIQVISRIRKVFHIEIQISKFFESSTIKQLAILISDKKRDILCNIKQCIEKEYYNLSPAQKQLWAISQVPEASIAYNIYGLYEFKGTIRVDIFEKAIKYLIARYEILRTYFIEVDGAPQMKIGLIEDIGFALPFINDHSISLNVIKEELQNVAKERFILSQAPLFKIKIYKTEDAFYVSYVIHHLISDGWSMGVFMEELIAVYNSIKIGEGPNLPILPIQYKDYSEWKNEQIENGSWDNQKKYWIEKLNKDIEPVNMPSVNERPYVQTFNGDSINYVIQDNTYKGINDFCIAKGITPFILFLSSLKILIYKYTGITDITVGTDNAGRNIEELEKQIGYFLNVLPIRTFVDPKDTLQEVVCKVKKEVVTSFDNQDYPIYNLLHELGIKKDLGRSFLFDIALILQNFKIDNNSNDGDIIYRPVEVSSLNSLLDMLFTITVKVDHININLRYNTDIYSEEIIRSLLAHYASIVDDVMNNYNTRLSAIEIIDNKEKIKILGEFNSTFIEYETGNIINLIYRIGSESPDNIALICGNKKFNYNELIEKIDEISSIYIGEYQIKKGDRIGLFLKRSIDSIIGMLAAIKIGAVYVPIDTDLPDDRVNFILQDANIKLILVDGNSAQRVMLPNVGTLYIGEIKSIKNNFSFNDVPVSLDDLAYIIYTSGTTGNPKGVMISHKALTDYVITFRNYFNISARDKALQQSSLSFDISIEEIFPVLISGGSLVIAPEGGRDIPEIGSIIEKEKITLLSTTPLVINELNKQHGICNTLRRIISGGDVLKPQYITNLLGKVEIYNTYGPSETTVCATYNKIGQLNGTEFIGKPITNRNVLIVNNDCQILPVGALGEICIGGNGLFSGYLNNEDLYKSKLVTIGDQLFYKTGDLGKWLSNGTIKFIGRNDEQVKIRGYRVDLNEIEQHVAAFDGIDEVTIVFNKEENEPALYAYYASAIEINHTSLRKFLINRAPLYMVPSAFIRMEALPLTINGKIDKKRLPKPGTKNFDDFQATNNPVEEKLVEMWRDVLGREENERISIDYNFFELGGHSLKATQLIYKIHKVFNVKLEIRDIFIHTTIEQQAQLILSRNEEKYKVIPNVKVEGYYDLSHSQRRLWVLSQLDGASQAYNLPFAFEVNGVVNLENLQRVFRAIVERHESLRTIFVNIDGEPKQKIFGASESAFRVNYIDLSEHDDAEKIARESIDKESSYDFDIENGPLFKVNLYGLSTNRFVILMNMHHIISDGWSVEVLVKEIRILYDAYFNNKENTIAPLRIQYKDFSSWQNQILESDVIRDQKEYWLNQFEQEIPALDFPTDYPRPKVQTYNGDILTFEFPEELTQQIRTFSNEYGVTIFMTLLSVIKTLFYRYTGQTDIVVGIPIAGRNNAELEDQIGFYANTLALRTRFNDEDTFIHLLEKVKGITLDAYANQLYTFDNLVEGLKIERDLSRNPLFDVMIVLQNTSIDNRGIPLFDNIIMKPFERRHVVSKFDLTFNIVEGNDKFRIDIEFNTDLFLRERIKRICGHLISLADILINKPGLKLFEFDYLSLEEKDQILNKFNNTKVDYPKNKTIIELFEEQVKRVPDDIAIVTDRKKLTYKKFASRVEEICCLILNNIKVTTDDIIAIRADRSIEMVASIFAILKTGAAYLPIDPNYPIERTKFVLSNSRSKMLLSYTEEDDIDLEGICPVVNLKKSQPNYKSHKNYISGIQPNNLAYVIYTSGSTGQPKGVMVEHHSLQNIIQTLQRRYPIQNGDVYLFKTNYVFDVSVTEIFGWFIGGGTLGILEKNKEKEPDAILDFILATKATHLNFVPSMFNVFVDGLNEGNKTKLDSLKYIFLAGEALHKELIKKFEPYQGNIVAENLYGPTEATVYASGYSLAEWDKRSEVPIGKPFDNVNLFILDKKKNVVPIGIQGELYIGGVGVAKGYVNNEVLIAENFVTTAYLQNKLYKTGDVVRWLPDGNIEYLGREDYQVKVRGFRIELGEIENRISKFTGIKENIVVARADKSGEKYLCAYYTSNSEVNEDALRDYLKLELPHYMIPAYYIKLASLPLTASGKLNRKALPELEYKISKQYKPPKTEVELKLVEIWSEVLGIGKEKISIDDSFFGVGGNSIKAIQIINTINKYFHININLKDIYYNQKLSDLSTLIESISIENKKLTILKLKEQKFYVCSIGQKRLWNLYKLNPSDNRRNMSFIFNISEKVDENAFKDIFNILLKRHEALRIYFKEVKGDVVQIIDNSCAVNFKFTDLSFYNIKDKNRIFKQIIKEETTTPFILETPPLYRISLLKFKNNKYKLIFIVHHIISDGWSIAILQKDFFALKDGKYLAPIYFQYKDYCAWENKILSNEHINAKEFWIRKVGSKGRFAIPFDKSLNNLTHYSSSGYKSFLNETITNKIKIIAESNQSSIFMFLLASLFVYISRRYSLKDLTIGVPNSNRSSEELKHIFGYFVGPIFIFSEINPKDTFESFFKKFTQNVLDVFSQPNLPIEKICEFLNLDFSYFELFPVFVNMSNFQDNLQVKADTKSTHIKTINNSLNVKIGIYPTEYANGIEIKVCYLNELYNRVTIENMVKEWILIINEIIQTPKGSVHNLNV